MVDIAVPRKKDRALAEFRELKPWEKTQDWSNPFEASSHRERERQEQRKRRKEKKKKSKSHRHKMTEEEYSEMSSKADTMLDDLLGDEEFDVSPSTLRVGKTKDGIVQPTRGGSNPFEDSEVEKDMNGDEINKEEYNALVSGLNKQAKKNVPPPVDDDDSTIQPPPLAEEPTSKNPFEDESVAESDAMEEDEEEPVPVSPPHNVPSTKNSAADEDLKRKPTDTTDEPGESEESSGAEEDPEEDDDEEDIVESSKRLLRMADQRLQYQQYNDEVKKLRDTITAMKHQAEAMSEQLRRAVETKCDLVLAQTEMERCHEQNLIAKDDEIHDMRLYVRELLDSQAQNELNFMNEISVLSKRMEEMDRKHKAVVAQKDNTISQLQGQIKAMQTVSVRGNSSPEALRHRFIESPLGTSAAPISVI